MVLAKLLGYVTFASAMLVSFYLAYDIRLYALRIYGNVIHEFGALLNALLACACA